MKGDGRRGGIRKVDYPQERSDMEWKRKGEEKGGGRRKEGEGEEGWGGRGEVQGGGLNVRYTRGGGCKG